MLAAAVAATAVGGLLVSCTSSGDPSDCGPSGQGATCSSSPVDQAHATPPAPTSGDWRRVLTQQFDEPAAKGRFRAVYPGYAAYDGGTDTSRNTARAAGRRGLWTSSTTTTVHDGMFDCFVHTKGVRPQVCALTPTPTGSWWGGQRYGRYTVRFRADPVPGYKVAWLLWPSSDRWSDGEIDFPEGDLDGSATASLHRIGDPEQNAFITDTRVPIRGWHTATIAWRPSSVTFTMDGRSWRSTAKDGLPKVPMYWALQVETSLSDSPPPRNASGHILIDWITIDAWRG